MHIAGNIIIAVGVIFMLFGVIGIIRYKNFYVRILVTSKIDTVGVITILIGTAVKHGLSYFSLKVLMMMAIVMIINPLTAHMIARSAYLSGYPAESQTGADDDHYNESHV